MPPTITDSMVECKTASKGLRDDVEAMSGQASPMASPASNSIWRSAVLTADAGGKNHLSENMLIRYETSMRRREDNLLEARGGCKRVSPAS